MKRKGINVDTWLMWAVFVEVLLGIALLIAGCKPKDKPKPHDPKMLQVTECDSTYWVDEAQLYTLEDSVHFYEDGM